jgi:hypothetical protein
LFVPRLGKTVASHWQGAQHRTSGLSIGLLGPCLSACAGPRGQRGLLDFLKDGVTTKEEALVHLGQPSGSFEDERILTWRLYEDKGGYYQQAPQFNLFINADFSLVLVFDARGVLVRHALVPLTAAPS